MTDNYKFVNTAFVKTRVAWITPPLGVNRSGRIESGAPLIVMGHPYGLPLKIGNGVVLDSSPRDHFTSNTDTYAGNSGSPVFNAATGLIEGVFIWGMEEDYVLRGRCYVSNHCPEFGGCEPQGVTKILNVLPWLPQPAGLPLFDRRG